MILSAHALLQHTHTPSREEIVEAISGNICRCTGYGQIVEAVQFAADRLQKSNILRPLPATPGDADAGQDAPEERVLEAGQTDASEIVR
jgi:carbon-monoxide dehydrogenase small subunit